MSRSKPDLDQADARDLIAEVDAADLARARMVVASGVQTAREAWIPVHLVADALALELLTLAEESGQTVRVAEYLRLLAKAVEASDAGRAVH